jgi:hypothetical protein
MLRVIFNSFLGILATVAGFYLAYLYLESLNQTGRPFYLLLSLPLIVFGIILLVRTSRSDESLVISTFQASGPQPDKPEKENSASLGNIMEKNNQLLNEWTKQSEKRDKMKILEIAAAAEEQEEKDSKTHV